MPTYKTFDQITFLRGCAYAVVWETGYTCHRTRNTALKKSRALGAHPHRVISRNGVVIREVIHNPA